MPRLTEPPPAPPKDLGGGGEGGERFLLPTGLVGLLVLLGVMTSLFAALVSAYLVRMGFPDWQSLPKPPLLFLNTLLLGLASWALEGASRRAQLGWVLGEGWAYSGLGLGLAFILGQLGAWRLLLNLGYAPAENPAGAFFYLATGLHGLHLLGGAVALGATLRRREPTLLRFTALYWHYLFGVWLVLLTLLLWS